LLGGITKIMYKILGDPTGEKIDKLLIDRSISGDLPMCAVTTIGDYAFYTCTNLQSVDFPEATTIGDYAFDTCNNLASVEIPAATTIGNHAFNGCNNLTSVEFPATTTIGNWAFGICTNLTSVEFPAATTIGNYAFANCANLQSVDFPAATTIGSDVFWKSPKLSSLVLRSEDVASLAGKFGQATPSGMGDPVAEGACYIYVPRALIEDYKVAPNWSTYASKFRALEDYTVDGTITGALDESKI
jgi:hypothetical protein